VQSGCIAAQLMHYPADLDRRRYQSVYATPAFRGAPRFSRVALVPGDDSEDVWRAEVRLLFKAYRPDDATNCESLALVKYFEYTTGETTSRPMPPSVLTHTYRAEAAAAAPPPADASGAGPSSAAARGSSSGRVVPAPRFSADGSRYTGAVRMRYAPESKALDWRFAVVPLSALIRVEHVLTDFNKHGLDGTYLAFYVNPFKWSLENVGDDDARGEQLEIAAL